jgi:hypothetical protein
VQKLLSNYYVITVTLQCPQLSVTEYEFVTETRKELLKLRCTKYENQNKPRFNPRKSFQLLCFPARYVRPPFYFRSTSKQCVLWILASVKFIKAAMSSQQSSGTAIFKRCECSVTPSQQQAMGRQLLLQHRRACNLHKIAQAKCLPIHHWETSLRRVAPSRGWIHF